MESWKRKTAFFLAGQTVSLFGSSLVQYALLWHLTLETRSGAVMTGYIICGFLPGLVLSPFAGVWADRYDRKKLIVLADAFIALVTLAAAIALFSGAPEIPLFFAMAALRSAGGAVHQPCVGAFLPSLVPEEQLTRVNGINGGIQSALMIASPMAAGALLGFMPVSAIFFIDVFTALIAIAILAFLVPSTHAQTGAEAPSGGYIEEIAAGMKYIRDHRFLKELFIYIGILYVLVSPAAFLTPLQTARSFGPEYWRLTAIEIAFSLGMLLGGAGIAMYPGPKNRMKTILAANAVMAACTIGLALSPVLPPAASFSVYLGFMGLFGVSMPFLNTPSTVLIQEHVDNAYLGRVFAVFGILSGSLMPLAMLVFGPLSDALKLEPILAATGAAMFILVLLVPLNRRLRNPASAEER